MKLGIEELSIIVEGLRLRVKQLSSSVTEINQSIENLENEDGSKAPAIMQTTSPAGIASFSDGAEDMPIKSLKCTIIPVQTGTGDPAPDNIRPITGWDGVDVVRTGKNLINFADVAETTKNGVTYHIKDGKLYINGTCTSGFNIYAQPLKLPSAQYTIAPQVLSGSISGNANSFKVYSSDSTRRLTTFGTNTTTLTFIGDVLSGVSGDTRASLIINSGAVFTNAVIGFQLELGASATAYEPYAADSHSISFPSSVYGGWVDVVEGKLHVTHGITNLGDLNWSMVTSGQAPFFSSMSALSPAHKYTGAHNNYLCSNYKATLIGTNGSTIGIMINDLSYVRVRDTEYNTPEAFKTAMSGVKLVYELATEQIIHIDPVTITTLLGNNNIYCDTGTVEVEYPADTKIYIDNAVAAVTPEQEEEEEEAEPAPEEAEEEEAEEEEAEPAPEEAKEEEAEPAPEEEEAEPVVKRATRKK